MHDKMPTSQQITAGLPTSQQITAGQQIAAELMDVMIEHTMGGLGGNECPTMQESANPDLLRFYLEHKIDSVTAIWLAMQRAA